MSLFSQKTSGLSDLHFKSIESPHYSSVTECELNIGLAQFKTDAHTVKSIITQLGEISLPPFVCFMFCACAVTSSVVNLAVSQSPGNKMYGGHMQLTTLLDPWPTSRIWLT